MSIMSMCLQASSFSTITLESIGYIAISKIKLSKNIRHQVCDIAKSIEQKGLLDRIPVRTMVGYQKQKVVRHGISFGVTDPKKSYNNKRSCAVALLVLVSLGITYHTVGQFLNGININSYIPIQKAEATSTWSVQQCGSAGGGEGAVGQGSICYNIDCPKDSQSSPQCSVQTCLAVGVGGNGPVSGSMTTGTCKTWSVSCNSAANGACQQSCPSTDQQYDPGTDQQPDASAGQQPDASAGQQPDANLGSQQPSTESGGYTPSEGCGVNRSCQDNQDGSGGSTGDNSGMTSQQQIDAQEAAGGTVDGIRVNGGGIASCSGGNALQCYDDEKTLADDGYTVQDESGLEPQTEQFNSGGSITGDSDGVSSTGDVSGGERWQRQYLY